MLNSPQDCLDSKKKTDRDVNTKINKINGVRVRAEDRKKSAARRSKNLLQKRAKVLFKDDGVNNFVNNSIAKRTSCTPNHASQY